MMTKQDLAIRIGTSEPMMLIASDGRLACFRPSNGWNHVEDEDVGDCKSWRKVFVRMHEEGRLKACEVDIEALIRGFNEAVRTIGIANRMQAHSFGDVMRHLGASNHRNMIRWLIRWRLAPQATTWWDDVDTLGAISPSMQEWLIMKAYPELYEFDTSYARDAVWNMTRHTLESILPGLCGQYHIQPSPDAVVAAYHAMLAGKTRMAAKLLGADGALMHAIMRPEEDISYFSTLVDSQTVSALLKTFGVVDEYTVGVAEYYGDPKCIASGQASDLYRAISKLDGLPYPHGFRKETTSQEDFLGFVSCGITVSHLEELKDGGISMEDIDAIRQDWGNTISAGCAAFLATNGIKAGKSFAFSTMPDVMVEHEGWIMRRMPKDSPLQFQVGTFASCCQHIGGQSEDLLAVIPFEDNIDNYYVASAGGTGIADMVVWRTVDGHYVIDSIEGRSQATEELMAKFVMDFAMSIEMDKKVYLSASDYGVTSEVCDLLRRGPMMPVPRSLTRLPYSDATEVYEILIELPHENLACECLPFRGTARNGKGA
ncbi:MAG: hypothetical protein E6Q68_06750 [Polynucleobacter sp.]|nr:MAG: hypothetical protein E6Q68_06750 [Polynucleobacter sp.]